MIKFFVSFLLLAFSCNGSFGQTNADSINQGKDSTAIMDTAIKDTALEAKDSTDSIHSYVAGDSGIQWPNKVYLTNSVLSINPYYNFLGTRQAQLMQEHKPESKDYLFYLMLVLLLYFGLLKVLFEKYINNFFLLFFRSSLRQQQIREQLLQMPLPSLLLNILFVISTGLYASFMMVHYHVTTQTEFPVLFTFSAVFLILLYALKFALLKICGWIFNISRATEAYIFIIFLVNKMMGILLLPFLLVMAFSSNPIINEIMATTSLIMIVILFIYRFSTAFKYISKEIKISIFHFFIYLCAFEITPLVLLYKVLLAYLEKAS